MENNTAEKQLVLGRQYKILNKIGQGKFGIVFQGIDIKKKQNVAIKTENKNTPYKLLKNETAILKYLYEQGSRNIPIIYWYGIHLEMTCLVFTYFELSLFDYIQKINHWEMNKKQEKINEIMNVCIRIIESIHNNLVLHRDIKPQNFMFKDGELFIIDFGLATFYIEDKGNHIENIDTHDTILGTPLYTSIHVHNGNSHSRRDDLISLGYIYLFMLYGELPWSIKNMPCLANSTQLFEENNIHHPYNLFRKEKKSMDTLENLFHSQNINLQKIKKYLNYCYRLDYSGSPHYTSLEKIFDDT